MLSPANRVLLQGGEVTNQVGYEYSGFLIFIKFLGLFSMGASTFIMRDVIHRLRRVTSSTAGGTASWRQKISLTQSIIFCLSIGDFFSWVYQFLFQHDLYTSHLSLLSIVLSLYSSYPHGWFHQTFLYHLQVDRLLVVHFKVCFWTPNKVHMTQDMSNIFLILCI